MLTALIRFVWYVNAIFNLLFFLRLMLIFACQSLKVSFPRTTLTSLTWSQLNLSFGKSAVSIVHQQTTVTTNAWLQDCLQVTTAAWSLPMDVALI